MSKILFDDENHLNNKEVLSVKCAKNCKYIDLWAEIEINGCANKFVIVFENKAEQEIEDGQLKTCQDYIDEFYGNGNYSKFFIFLRGDDVKPIDRERCRSTKFRPISLNELTSVLQNFSLTGNDLFDEFWFNWFLDEEIKKNIGYNHRKTAEDIFGK